MKTIRWYHRLWWSLRWSFRLHSSRPRIYVHNSVLKSANAAYRARLRFVGYMVRNGVYRRAHHRDLLTGMAVALTTGLRTANARGRPGPYRYGASVKGVKLAGKPVVYERRVEPKNPFSNERVRIVRVGETEWL